MNTQSIFVLRNWSWLQILLLAAACFALAAIGFFIAVFLQLHSAPSSQTQINIEDPAKQAAQIRQKADYMEQVAQKSGQTQVIDPNKNRNQTDESDPEAKAKLDYMRRVSGQ